MLFSDNFYNHQIDKAFYNAPIVSTDIHKRIVLFSDCHRGNGTWSDNFLSNKTVYEAALTYYFNNGFTYIELGDGDELWGNRKFSDITEIHNDIFDFLDKFRESGRLYMLWGNHDRVKSSTGFATDVLPASTEAILVEYARHAYYYLLHGHQADLLNNQAWKIARWLVRYLWRPLELCGFKNPTSAAGNYNKCQIVEQRIISWAKQRNAKVVAGHTHRPAIILSEDNSFEEAADAKNTDWRYCNTGSCVHPGSITCIEMDRGQISLIKWATCSDASQYIHVCRHTISGPFDM